LDKGEVIFTPPQHLTLNQLSISRKSVKKRGGNGGEMYEKQMKKWVKAGIK
jgi:hypothetical protein